MNKLCTVKYLLSGLFGGIRISWVAAVVGIAFLAFGFTSSLLLFKVLGALVLLFFIIITVKPIIDNHLCFRKEIGAEEFQELIGEVYNSESNGSFTFFERVSFAAEKRIQETE